MKVVVCTPAGRKRYLEILKGFLVNNPVVTEWHLWQNCRKQSDLEYIYELARREDKVKIIEENFVDGTNRSVNKFYRRCSDPDTFYIKIDDDIVYINPNTIERLLSIAKEEKGRHLYWSPVVINNAVCSAVLSARGILETGAFISAQASDNVGWRSPLFALRLHEAFLNILDKGAVDELLDDYRISLGAERFSINCIGFWGDAVSYFGDQFCPPTVDDEEWISAVLPIKSGLSGRLVGNALVSHYSFYTQEFYINRSQNILARYGKFVSCGAPDVPDKVVLKKMMKNYVDSLKGYVVDFAHNKLGFYMPSQKLRYFAKFKTKVV